MRLFVVFFAMLTVFPVVAGAEQYVRGNQVVHTRLAPVVVHRVFPPYHGIHVYQGRAARR